MHRRACLGVLSLSVLFYNKLCVYCNESHNEWLAQTGEFKLFTCEKRTQPPILLLFLFLMGSWLHVFPSSFPIKKGQSPMLTIHAPMHISIHLVDQYLIWFESEYTLKFCSSEDASCMNDFFTTFLWNETFEPLQHSFYGQKLLKHLSNMFFCFPQKKENHAILAQYEGE